MRPIVVMGVSGSGKSSLGQAIAARLGVPMVEGDAFHSPANLTKMRAGVALDDKDRTGWLDALSAELQRHAAGAVVSCSALKRAYRDRLRDAAPGLRFVHLELTPDEARRRVALRMDNHFFQTRLVDSQFEALESPRGESGVLGIDAMLPPDELLRRVLDWTRENAP
jgi:gluconokinase